MMESIKRVIMMLKSDNTIQSGQTNTAVLKLQSTIGGLIIDLAIPVQPSDSCSLYLFDQQGDDHFAGDIKEGGLHTKLGVLSLNLVTEAAIIDTKTLAFLLKTSGPNWTDIASRFKFKHALPKPDSIRTEPEEIELPQPEEYTPISPAPPQPEEYTPISPAPPQPEQPRLCDTCPHVIRQDKINPFPSAFPGSEWVKISYPGPTGWWHYISGKIRSGDTVIVKVLGVPGEYGMAPPIWLEGFGTYMRSAASDASGYWLMFQDAETGEVLDMGLSPHGG